MDFTIKVDEFSVNEDELIKRVSKYVKENVFSKIEQSIHDRVEKQVEMEVKEMVEKILYTKLSNEIKNEIETGLTKSRRKSDTKITFKEYVRECFEYEGGYKNFDETIKTLAKSFTSELKHRYDLLFASQIVAKLNDNGLLKDDVAKLIIDK